MRGSDLVQDLTYFYNANGTVQQRHDHLIDPFPEVFSYDELNHLTERRQRQSSGSERVESFAYDALGNLTQMPGVGRYTFVPGWPQLVATAGGYEFTHDANGNLDSRSGPGVPGGSQAFDYTAFDMPSRITPAPGSSAPDVELEYDAFAGRAVKRATEPCAGSTCPSTTTLQYG